MNGSATTIWIIVTVAVAGLVIWLGSVALAAGQPAPRRLKRAGDGPGGRVSGVLELPQRGQHARRFVSDHRQRLIRPAGPGAR
jgi:hypothetical protein